MINKYPLIYLEWCDAFTKEDKSWYNYDEIIDWADNHDWIIRQVGFLIKETDEYILLCAQLNPQSEGGMMLGLTTKIPKTWIRKKKIIKI